MSSQTSFPTSERTALPPIVLIAQQGEVPCRLWPAEPEWYDPMVKVQVLLPRASAAVWQFTCALPLVSYCDCNLHILWNVTRDVVTKHVPPNETLCDGPSLSGEIVENLPLIGCIIIQ